MFRSRRLTLPYGANELASIEVSQRRLHPAFREPGIVCDALMAGVNALRSRAERARPEVHVHDERGRRFVVADQVREQRLEDIAVEGDCI